jgi:hypothetical protein
MPLTDKWQPIETAPKTGAFLATTWEPGDPWPTEIEVLSHPMHNGQYMNLNSGNYTRASFWKFWMPLPPPPMEQTNAD